MRTLTLILIVIMVAIACKKEQLAPTTTLTETIVGVDTTAVLKYSGNFSNGPYGSSSGKAAIYKTATGFVLQLSNFNVSNGPALRVYLSKEAMPVNFIDLGTLKSTSGHQVYTILNEPDFISYKYVSIHCVAFNHLFGSALLN